MAIITIIATDIVKGLAQQALDIQDACNIRGVTSFFQEVQAHFSDLSNGQNKHGGDVVAQNPVGGLILNKICHLAHHRQDKSNTLTDACTRLSLGHNVKWDIDFN
jgi:hypothetical protein